jgi:outer membrane protein assembly factor BamA
MRVSGVWICALAASALMAPSRAAAQDAGPAATQAAQPAPAPQQPAPATREAAIEQKQAAKAEASKPYEPNAGERWAKKAQDILVGGGLKWHPFFENAYSGGGFTLGAGYKNFVSAYNTLDVRGSYTFSGYKRVEAEFIAPRLFNRRGTLTLLGGWREATQVGFYGIGNDTVDTAKTNYLFQRPYASADLLLKPTRRFLTLGAGVEWTQWKQKPGEGPSPSVETVYTPATLPGLGATIDYLHTQATLGLDGRESPGYARRGAYIGATAHDYRDGDERFGFQQVDYEAIGHLPVLRETWVFSAHALASTSYPKDGQEVPYFMLPALGGGSSLRGFSSWRFRDRHSLLLQGEWRIMVNRYLDTAFFYDAGKVANRTSDLNFDDLHSDFGFGLRFHGPFATPLRVELAKSKEGLAIVFSSSAAF